MPTDWERALAVVAHPDDLEYGAAAAIAHWTDQGKDVRYLLATRGEAGIDDLEPGQSARVRVREQQASAAVVGVSEVEFLDHGDGVIEEGVALRRDLAGAIRRHRPELIVMLTHTDTWGPGYWNSADHRAVGRSTLDAAMDAGNRWIFPEQLAEQGLRPWNGVRWVAAAGAPDPTHVQEVSDRDVERAVASLAEHRAYLSALSDQEPAEYARTFLQGVLEGMAEQTGGRQALGFRLYPR
ncbi:PIG-L family deacetylase [Streptomyces durbertensis]|uniref:PIG-L family deacetylase n=1 Tax=Streptomyces durbertensis TaxID=2448886 RepID=A0ABR6EEC5_9ACTN|nr:PIG-L deacetylase family protein [Streptomyces durbertensis]MBB1243691.1 PIG-L family deacetylase [Streptomyces durbertensis]